MKRRNLVGTSKPAAIALLIVAAVLISGCATSRVSRSYVFTDRIDELLVDLDAGNVIVNGTDGDATRVEVDLVCRGGKPGHAVELARGRLDVEARAGWAGEEACGGTVRIETPRRASLDVSVGRGDVQVNGVEGEVQAETYEGDIECDGKTDQVAMKTVAGRPASGLGIIFH